MALAVNVLKEQIEKAKRSLKNVDENIKKITGRDPNERRTIAEGQRSSTGSGRGRQRDTILGRRDRGQRSNFAGSEPPSKRSADAEVFSRLGGVNPGRRVVISRFGSGRKHEHEDEEDEDEAESSKPAVQSSIVSTAKKITKKDLISAQNVGEKGKARNRRMFGVLLGTLARFQSDSNSPGQQMKQVQRQQEIERRLEEQTTEERKKAASQRRTLFNERRAQQKRIELLEQKIALADEVVEWEKEWAKKSNFIMTKASPPLFFLPTDHTARTQRALKESKEKIQGIIEKHRESIEETMKSIDAEIESLEKKSCENGKRDDEKVCDTGINGSKNSSSKGKSNHDPEEEMDLDSMGPTVDIKVELDDTEGHHNQENIDDDYSDKGAVADKSVFDDISFKEEPDSHVSDDQVQTDQDKSSQTDNDTGDEDSDREYAVGNRDSDQHVVGNSEIEDCAKIHSQKICNVTADKQSETPDVADVQTISKKDADLEKSNETVAKGSEIIMDTNDGNAHPENPSSPGTDENDSDKDGNRNKEGSSDSKSGDNTSSSEGSPSGEEDSEQEEQEDKNNISEFEKSVARKSLGTSPTKQDADEPEHLASNKHEMDMPKKKSPRGKQQKTTRSDSDHRQDSTESSDSSDSASSGSSSGEKKQQKRRTKRKDSNDPEKSPLRKSQKGKRRTRSRSRSRDGRTSARRRSRDRRNNDGKRYRERR